VTHITIASVTIYLHRHQAHRALELHAIPSHFFRFWLWLTTGQVTKEWAAIHRKHHAKCDTEEDPHSPVTRGIKKVLFEGAELYRAESKNRKPWKSMAMAPRRLDRAQRLHQAQPGRACRAAAVINFALFGVIGITIWAIQMMWIPITAAGIINGLGHYWGYRNYDCADAATNIIPFGILIGGEELHNNHHTFATSAKLSSKWYEFDIGWAYIRALEMMGLAKVKKVAPEPKFAKDKLVADLDTLQSVITNRYDVMAKYAKSVKHAFREELEHLKAQGRAGKRFLKSSRKLLQREPAKLEASQKQQLVELFKHSKALETMHHMRVELGAIWERSHSTRDQLLHQLQDWCVRAEASGIKSLQEFSLRLRSYAFHRHRIAERAVIFVREFRRVEHIVQHGLQFRRVPRGAVARPHVDVMPDFAVLFWSQRQAAESGPRFGVLHDVLPLHAAMRAPLNLRAFAGAGRTPRSGKTAISADELNGRKVRAESRTRSGRPRPDSPGNPGAPTPDFRSGPASFYRSTPARPPPPRRAPHSARAAGGRTAGRSDP
jgi:stearoyl-CoA desaturase (delta-9 desaturase)